MIASLSSLALASVAFAAPGYVGSDACTPCHAAEAAHYRKTPMAGSSGSVDQALPAGIVKRFNADTRPIRYFIGSGHAGRSFLFEHDGFLFLAPVTWYTEARRWDLSPGYTGTRWNRPIEPNCLFCHTTRAQPIYGTQNRYAEPAFVEAGIGCERCHGPGSEHAAGRGPIVQPAKLAPFERDSVCAQCHLTGEARINRAGKELAMYRPGDKLSDYVSVFVSAGAAARRLRVTSHMEKLSYSRCKQASGDRLWCGACHSPHRATEVRTQCLECHAAKLEAGHASRTGCVECHMPRTRAADANHGVFTDHSIPRRPANESSARTGKLAAFPGFVSDDRLLGLAYAEASLETNDESQKREAVRLLRQATPQDWNLLTRLAFLEPPARALALYERSLQLKPHQPVALINAGTLHAQRGDVPRAIEYWRKALAMNPGLDEASRNLATALRATGRIADADRVLQDAARFGK